VPASGSIPLGTGIGVAEPVADGRFSLRCLVDRWDAERPAAGIISTSSDETIAASSTGIASAEAAAVKITAGGKVDAMVSAGSVGGGEGGGVM